MSRGNERNRPDPATRAGRSAFAAASATALYTAAVFGGLLYLGMERAQACFLSAGAGLLIACLAGYLVHRAEIARRRRRVAQAQLETQLANAARPPAPESGFAATESREIRESREIQRALLPSGFPVLPGYRVEAAYLPCGELGGDFYGVFPLDADRVLFTLGDVSGKGPGGAIVMAMVQTLFREHARAAAGPADLLDRVNSGFSGILGKGIFVTAVAGVLEIGKNRLTLAGAGHHPALLLNARARRSTFLSAPGPALGLLGRDRFASSETSVDLEEDDALLLYTDGATENARDFTDATAEHRFRAAAAAAVLGGREGALDRLRKDLGLDSGRRDDVTLLLLSREGSVASKSRAAAPADGCFRKSKEKMFKKLDG